MAATALIRFTQGTNVGGDGMALLGVLLAPVYVSNVDNTSVRSWQVDLVAAATGSALALGTVASSDNSSTPAATFTPDARGSYRVVLRLWEAPGRVGDADHLDIRVFAVSEANGLVAPPPQLWPLPLPDPRSGAATARPNELNFLGQDQGWAGAGEGDGLLTQLVRTVDAQITAGATPSPNTATAFDRLSAIGVRRAVATIFFQDRLWVLNAGDYNTGERASLVRWDLGTDTPDAVVASPSESELWLNVAADAAGRLWVVGDDQRGAQRFMRVISFVSTPPTVGPKIVCGSTPPNRVSPSSAALPVAAPLAYTGTSMWTTILGYAVSVTVATMTVANTVAPSRAPDFVFANVSARNASESTLTASGLTARQTDNNTYWVSEWDSVDGGYYWVARSTGGAGLQGGSNTQPQWVVYDGTTGNYADSQPRLWLLSSSYEQLQVSPYTVTPHVVLDRLLATAVDATLLLDNHSPHHLLVGGTSVYVLAAGTGGDQLLRVTPDTLVVAASALAGTLVPLRAAYEGSTSSIFVLCRNAIGNYHTQVLRTPTLAEVASSDVPGELATDDLEPLLPNVLATTPSGWLPLGASRVAQILAVDLVDATYTSHVRRGLGYVPATDGGRRSSRILYVDASTVGAQDGSATKPFSNLQLALDVINNNTDTAQLLWCIQLAPGAYAAVDGAHLRLAPAWVGVSSYYMEFHVHLQGSGTSLTTLLAPLLVVFPVNGRNCSVFLSDLESAQSVVLENDVGARTPALDTEHVLALQDASIGTLVCTAMRDARLQVRIKGVAVATSLASSDRFSTARVAGMLLSGIVCHVYAEGAHILGECQVSGGLVLRNTDLNADVNLTAAALTLVDSGHRALGVGVLQATGAARSIEMDGASFAKVIKYGTRFEGSTQLHAIGNAEFCYEFPVVETHTDESDQQLFAQELQYWPLDIVVGVRAVVTACNRDLQADYGYFERVALYSRSTSSGAPVVTLRKEGDSLFASGLTQNMDSAHSVRFAVQDTSAVLLCSPSSSSPGSQVNSWKAVVYFAVHKAY
jgi:hypothetical protein